MKTLFKQPILHFLVLALLLFVIYGKLNPDAGRVGSHIVIDDSSLKNYLQYQTRNFSEGYAQSQWQNMSREEKHKLAEGLIRDEVLYREAAAMNLDKDDYVIRQRMIQKMEYLVRGFDDADAAPDRDTVENFYQQNQERYREPPTATFTHVFVSSENRSREELQKAASALLAKLNDQHIPFAQATSLGNRFIYHVNYVERSKELVSSHFGDEFAGQLFKLQPDQSHWQGPIVSRYGLHLVLLTALNPGGVPPLDEIFNQVASDARQWQKEQRAEKAVAELIGHYDIDLEIDGSDTDVVDTAPEPVPDRVSQQ